MVYLTLFVLPHNSSIFLVRRQVVFLFRSAQNKINLYQQKSKEFCFTKYLEKLSTKNLWRQIPTKKSLKRNLYQRNFWRDISNKIFEEKFLPKQIERKPYQKFQVKNSLPKKLRREISAFFLKKNLYRTKQRSYLYLKICEKKTAPKNVWKDISTKASQETSPPTQLRREISSKESLKKQIQ